MKRKVKRWTGEFWMMPFAGDESGAYGPRALYSTVWMGETTEHLSGIGIGAMNNNNEDPKEAVRVRVTITPIRRKGAR